MNHMKRSARLLVVPILALAPLSACSSEDDGHGGHSSGDESMSGMSIPESADHNMADAHFSTMMIPHHAQALEMVDLTMGRKGLSPEFTALAEQIRAAQAPEIEQMSDWLEEWDLPVPATGRDHVHGGGHGSSGAPMDDMHMDGMMTEEQMTELEQAPDAEFEDLWLQMMIEHHQGAIDMAETEIADGEYADTVALATSIKESQQAEIDQMESMLAK